MKKNLLLKLTSLGLAAVMAVGMTACGKQAEEEVVEDNKPEKITMTFDTCMTFENGVQDVLDKYKEMTGITLELDKPDHDKYYEKVTLAFASGNASDVIEMGSAYYPQNASEKNLWDMTAAWEKSDLAASGIVNADYVEGLKIDGKLYGFPTVAGNGTVTYVRQDWLDEAGLEMPSDYAGFIDMLRAFKQRGNDIIPITAAGVLNGDAPYDIFMREFYQDATPDFYQREDGTWVDGFSEDAMKAAMQRFQDAYKEGLIDPDVVTNDTKSCREKFKNNLVGAFNYWAGSWCAKLEDSAPGSKLAAMPAIAEVKATGGYTGRTPLAMVINAKAENPEGIFEHLILFSHDGGEGQKLFTYGVEGVHYTDNGDGTITAMPQQADPTKTVEKSFYAPEYSITTWNDPMQLDSRITDSLNVYLQARSIAPVPPASKVLTENQMKIDELKNRALADALHGNKTPDEAMEKYVSDSAQYVEAVLADLSK
ncbi:MAG: extracellular solute-binding protein [Firmicutes bacterium]|nr:extracellular solute-binding protein [Bacillota bacterium]